MTTDAEYRALAERLAELGEHAKRLHDQAYDTDLPENGDLSAASSAILALLEERDAATKVAEMNATAGAFTARQLATMQSRLGKAVDLLQRTINGPAATHEKEWALFDETMAFLSDLEKSE